MINAVLFDLDGTLLDTANDLGHALNQLLMTHGKSTLPQEQIREFAGAGCKGLLKLGMNMDNDHPHYSEFCQQLLALYHQHMLSTTRLFPGMDEVLTLIEEKDLPWGVVTNKPAKFTDPLMAHLKLSARAACIISGDTLPTCKPSPEPILHACKLLARHPSECLYVGDSKIDIVACKAAGNPSLAALYGYIPATDDPKTWEADGYIQQPLEIIHWLNDSNTIAQGLLKGTS
jgi:N-acetyl-D-muramate 6-phosphate phosphatase